MKLHSAIDHLTTGDMFDLVVGICLGLLIAFLPNILAASLLAPRKPKSEQYGLDHSRLNLTLPVRPLWLNMGYWTAHHQSDDSPITAFPTACRTLLDELLRFADFGVSGNDIEPVIDPPNGRAVNVLDAGVGCGDQSVILLDAHMSTGGRTLRRYLGLTLESAHASIAADRIKPYSNRALIRRGDAANPHSWTCTSHDQKDWRGDTWLLALDSAYHFAPSRLPLLKWARQSRSAHFAAFDLMLHPSATLVDRLMLRLVYPLLGAPHANLLTPDEYVALVVQAGYSLENIRVRDVSTHVLGGMAGFLAKRDADLAACGLGGIGKLRAAQWLFAWWARSGCVRGCFVVARARARDNEKGLGRDEG